MYREYSKRSGVALIISLIALGISVVNLLIFILIIYK
jgi:hypothetical protein